MATQPMGQRPTASTPYWSSTSPTCSHTNLLAGVRAGVIALLLLVILVFIVLL